MTTDEFRASPEQTTRMAMIVSDATFQLALAAVSAEREQKNADDGDDAIVSVRVLARDRERSGFIKDLLTMAVPISGETSQPFPDFGTGLSQEELAEAMTN